MMSPYIPSVLQATPDSISTERALKQIIKMLNLVVPHGDDEEDMLEASIADAQIMLAAIRRED